MKPWRRVPREVYRVYGEEEFFAAHADDDDTHTGTEIAVEPQARTSNELPQVRRGSRGVLRAACVAALTAIAGAIVTILVLSVLSAGRGAKRRAPEDQTARSDASSRPERTPIVTRGRRSALATKPLHENRSAAHGSRTRSVARVVRRGQSRRADIRGAAHVWPLASASPSTPPTPPPAPGLREFGFER